MHLFILIYIIMVLTRRMARGNGRKIQYFIANRIMPPKQTDQRHQPNGRYSTRRCTTQVENTSNLSWSCTYHRSTSSFQSKTGGLHIGTLNIMDSRDSRLQLSFRQLLRHNLDLAVLTEATLNGIQTTKCDDYDMLATKCTNQCQGGVATLVKQSRWWHL